MSPNNASDNETSRVAGRVGFPDSDGLMHQWALQFKTTDGSWTFVENLESRRWWVDQELAQAELETTRGRHVVGQNGFRLATRRCSDVNPVRDGVWDA